MDIKTKITLLALPSALLASTSSFARAELIDCLDDCMHAEYDCEDDAMQIEDTRGGPGRIQPVRGRGARLQRRLLGSILTLGTLDALEKKGGTSFSSSEPLKPSRGRLSLEGGVREQREGTGARGARRRHGLVHRQVLDARAPLGPRQTGRSSAPAVGKVPSWDTKSSWRALPRVLCRSCSRS